MKNKVILATGIMVAILYMILLALFNEGIKTVIYVLATSVVSVWLTLFFVANGVSKNGR